MLCEVFYNQASLSLLRTIKNPWIKNKGSENGIEVLSQ
jgi:hypothetical protein